MVDCPTDDDYAKTFHHLLSMFTQKPELAQRKIPPLKALPGPDFGEEWSNTLAFFPAYKVPHCKSHTWLLTGLR